MTNRFFYLLFTIFCAWNSIPVMAQNTGENELGAWYMYFGTNKLSEQWSLHTEAQFRYYQTTGNFNQMLLRTGVNYHIAENAMATLGYAYIDTDTEFEEFTGEKKANEHRVFQQFILKNNVGKFAFEHRYRLEQRFLQHYETQDTQHRARYRLQVTYPLPGQWFLNVYDEIFINLQEPLFGQNRLYGALGYKLNSELSFQAGYLKNHFTGSNYDRLQLAIFYNPDLSKRSVQ
ncbi:DUF2490 domain-containing protein [Robertkochia marina]|uniref:DUF2490 domain-containing protein n=2 Tax=Robertkochia marina TaxID=1227945 RepID=A0A4S3M1P1_9FLAO|nr:DUF2490 domain-containing protein [Robertkochia marina]TRZ43030.1 DUF2490 domain-containing protein [Robertkochia marina]